MMNVNECKIKDLEQEITELKAHVERLKSAINKILDDPNTFRMYEHEELNKELSDLVGSCQTQSLQEHDRQVILRMVNSGDIALWHDRRFMQVDDVEWYANNLANGDDNG